MLETGLRVVRGRDWNWNDQDGGEGHAGTVVAIGKPPTAGNEASNVNHGSKIRNKTVIVQWDNGDRRNYRIGYKNAYDLMVFDNAAAGVRHLNIICNGCKAHGIIGIRWKCSQCFDYDLCTQCYMSGVHDLKHAFQRFLTSNSVGIQLTARENCTKILLKGIFIGAKVIRGPCWKWGNQDGGVGSTGRVIDIRDWNNDSSRSLARVTWPSGSANVYRLGYKGCVDLTYVEEASAGTYYKEHLPLLGQPTPSLPVNDDNAVIAANVLNPLGPSHIGREVFRVGDKVKVLMDINTLKSMQAGHGGWNRRKANFIGEIGTVRRITAKGGIRVQFKGSTDRHTHRCTFHPETLTKVNSREKLTLGDIIIIIIIIIINPSYKHKLQLI